MIKKITLIFLLFIFCKPLAAQEIYNSFSIPKGLKENANAVIRLSETEVIIGAIDAMRVKKKRVVTVLNKKGKEHVNTYLYYDKSIAIRKLSAKVYDAFGQEIKRYRKSDFDDESAVSGGTMYSDSRVKYLNYIPKKYPYTIEFVSEYTTKTTAGSPAWFPIDGYNVSVEKSTYTFISEKIGFKKKIYNPKSWIPFDLQENGTSITCKITNQMAIKYENQAPIFTQLMPYVDIMLNQFSLYGKIGEADNWQDFGKWQYNNLLKGRDELGDELLVTVSKLTQNLTNPLDKARVIYKYVQDNTRYISVQLGIGGLQPERANDVDRLKYGDCKGLTNYTKALLQSQGIEAYYAEVYSGEDKKNFDKEFTSFQGDHIILCLPQKEGNVWLECTSQTIPFGFLGDFTDDRDVLVMKPKGGEIMHTTKYTQKENTQNTNTQINITAEAELQATINIKSKGLQYGNLRRLGQLSLEKQKEYYLNKWSYLNGLTIVEQKISNDKVSVLFEENISVSVSKYILKINDKFLVPLNLFNRRSKLPTNYIARKLPFQISRSFKDIDSCILAVPGNYKVEFLPENVEIASEFGSYQIKIRLLNNNKIEYIRSFSLKEGVYANGKYAAYRNFIKKVIKKDKLKLMLTQNKLN